MQAAVIRDGSIWVETRPDPVPGLGQLLVRVRAAGLNGADIAQRAGGARFTTRADCSPLPV